MTHSVSQHNTGPTFILVTSLLWNYLIWHPAYISDLSIQKWKFSAANSSSLLLLRLWRDLDTECRFSTIGSCCAECFRAYFDTSELLLLKEKKTSRKTLWWFFVVRCHSPSPYYLHNSAEIISETQKEYKTKVTSLICVFFLSFLTRVLSASLVQASSESLETPRRATPILCA